MQKSTQAQRFRDIIESYIKEHDDPSDPYLTDYHFEEDDEKVSFLFDGMIYELLNYGLDLSEFGGGIDFTFRDGLKEALKDIYWEPYNYYTWSFYKINEGMEKACDGKTEKGEEKIPITDDDTVEIEEMDGEKYIEIEPKEEHAEEVATGYEKESDDLNTEDNITHPDTSKPKESKKSKTEKDGLSCYLIFFDDKTMQKMVDYIDTLDEDSASKVWEIYSQLSPYEDTSRVVNGQSVRFVKLYPEEVEEYASKEGYTLIKSKTKKSYHIGFTQGNFGDYYYLSRSGDYGTDEWDDVLTFDSESEARAYFDKFKAKHPNHYGKLALVDSNNVDLDTGKILIFEPIEKSSTKKALIDFEAGMTLKEFFERNKRGGNSIMGFDLYSVRLDGKQVGTNYTGVESYADYYVDSYEMDDILGLLDINISKSGSNEYAPREFIKDHTLAFKKCRDYQLDHNRVGITADEVYMLTGQKAEKLLADDIAKGRVRRIHCSDGKMYKFRM